MASEMGEELTCINGLSQISQRFSYQLYEHSLPYY
jgi:hypothetical protein